MLTVMRATGELRTRTQTLLANEHYMRSAGGSGWLYAACDGDRVVGGCLIGPSASMAAERSIVAPPYRIQVIKRSYLRDGVTDLVESQFLRWCMRDVAERRSATTIFISYADPAACDTRTGLPLLGWCYLVSGFMLIGETSQPRYAVIDTQGRARSSRQGRVTLTRASLPPGWSMQRIPPARIWMAVVTPTSITVDGISQPTSQRWRKREWLAAWRVQPTRRIAAQQWYEQSALRRLERAGLTLLGQPRQIKAPNVLQAAWWAGTQLRRTAGPVWVPVIWQERLIDAALLEGERVAGRHYQPIHDHFLRQQRVEQ